MVAQILSSAQFAALFDLPSDLAAIERLYTLGPQRSARVLRQRHPPIGSTMRCNSVIYDIPEGDPAICHAVPKGSLPAHSAAIGRSMDPRTSGSILSRTNVPSTSSNSMTFIFRSGCTKDRRMDLGVTTLSFAMAKMT